MDEKKSTNHTGPPNLKIKIVYKKGKWNKYNIKSIPFPKGKESSMAYGIWLKMYGEEKATSMYMEFKYRATHWGDWPPSGFIRH